MEVLDLDFDPGDKEELLRLYGPTVTDWGDVQSWQDVVPMEEKSLVSHLEEANRGKPRCPFLASLDDYFFYCKLSAENFVRAGLRETDAPRPGSAQYAAKVDTASLQLFCMCSEADYKKCIEFTESQPAQSAL